MTGDAGTYLVASQLALRGWPVSLTTAGTTRTDLFAQVGSRLLPAAIQVKTKSHNNKRFEPTSVDGTAAEGANEWVVLVALARDRLAHEFYVVPRDVDVATVLTHRLKGMGPRVWLGPEEYAFYRGQWDLLELPSWQAPWRVRSWIVNDLGNLPWPDDHAGPPRDVAVYEEPDSAAAP